MGATSVTSEISGGNRDVPAAIDAARALIVALGISLDAEAMLNTPARFVKAYLEILTARPFESRSFENHSGFNGTVTLRSITFESLCEHHLLPFTGWADVSYEPGKQVIGLSKLAWIVRDFAAAPQLQERMTQQIAEKIAVETRSASVTVRIVARHSCLTLRGAKAENAEMETFTSLTASP